ncbi:MAG: hypothetical protein ACP5CD_02870 [Thermovirgaceae bacterium]
MKKEISVALVVLFALITLCGSQASAASIPERMSGNYLGTFIGDDYGSLRLTISPDGVISGIAHSNVSYEDLEISGKCNYDGTCEFVTAGKPLRFFGSIDFMNRFIGKWESTEGSERGSFTAIITRE